MWGRRKAPVETAVQITDVTPAVRAAYAGLERELTVVAERPGSWLPERRDDPAARRIRRENALHADREALSRLL